MKVALCFSGLPRMVTQTHKYWQEVIINKHSTDVFVHTWDWKDSWNPNTSLKNTLQSLYNPRVLVIDQPKTFDVSKYVDRVWPHRTTPAGVLSQWYSVKQSVAFKKQQEQAYGVKYDLVIRARFDWFLKDHQFVKNPCVNVAFTPTLAGHRFLWNGLTEIGINDQFGYGSSETMDIYSALFDNIPYLYLEKNIDFCSELFLKAHLLDNSIEVFEHAMQNGITRLTGIIP